MALPHLILITGLPGSGKTTLAEVLSSRLSLPLFKKDAIKEILFDRLGWSDRQWSKKLGVVTYDVMDHFVDQLLGSGHSLILESNFKPEFDNERFRKWKEEYHCEIIQILCHAEPATLLERFTNRVKKDERHPGHADAENLKEWQSYYSNLTSTIVPINVESRMITVDTNDFSKINHETLLDFIYKTYRKTGTL